jgi:hypothetical protein
MANQLRQGKSSKNEALITQEDNKKLQKTAV